ncbi:MAG: DUF5320 domain-containing protein [Bacillota bacterium]
MGTDTAQWGDGLPRRDGTGPAGRGLMTGRGSGSAVSSRLRRRAPARTERALEEATRCWPA